MLQFFLEGFSELAETCSFVQEKLSDHYNRHFVSKPLAEKVALGIMLAFAAVIILFPSIISLPIAAVVIILSPILLGTITFAQSCLATTLYWGKSIPRLKNRLPSGYAPLQENILLLLCLSLLSCVPIIGFKIRALLLLPLFMTQLYMAKELIDSFFKLRAEDFASKPMATSAALLTPLITYSGLKNTADFFGAPTPFSRA